MKNKIVKLSIIISLFFFVVSVLPKQAWAANFGLDPSSRQIEKGQQININVNLDTSGRQVNVSEAILSFNESVLEFKGASFGSIFPFNTHSVTGNLVFISSSFNDGTSYFQGSSQWATLTFEAKSTGQSVIQFTSRSVIGEIGTLENIFSVGNAPTATITVVDPGSGGDEDSNDDNDNDTPASAPTCDKPAPGNPGNLRAATGPKVGQVALTWDKGNGATHYSVLYGVSAGTYIYGATNVGNTSQYVVSALTPGRLYYFTVLAWNDCASSGYSNEASARGYYVAAAAGTKVTATPTPLPVEEEEPAEGFEPIGQILPSVDEDLSAIAASPTPTPAYETEVIAEDESGGLGGWIKGNLAYVLGGLAVLIFIIALLVLFLPGSSSDSEDDWPSESEGRVDDGENPQPMDNTPSMQENESQTGASEGADQADQQPPSIPITPPPPPLPTE